MALARHSPQQTLPANLLNPYPSPHPQQKSPSSPGCALSCSFKVQRWIAICLLASSGELILFLPTAGCLGRSRPSGRQKYFLWVGQSCFWQSALQYVEIEHREHRRSFQASLPQVLHSCIKILLPCNLRCKLIQSGADICLLIIKKTDHLLSSSNFWQLQWSFLFSTWSSLPSISCNGEPASMGIAEMSSMGTLGSAACSFSAGCSAGLDSWMVQKALLMALLDLTAKSTISGNVLLMEWSTLLSDLSILSQSLVLSSLPFVTTGSTTLEIAADVFSKAFIALAFNLWKAESCFCSGSDSLWGGSSSFSTSACCLSCLGSFSSFLEKMAETLFLPRSTQPPSLSMPSLAARAPSLIFCSRTENLQTGCSRYPSWTMESLFLVLSSGSSKLWQLILRYSSRLLRGPGSELRGSVRASMYGSRESSRMYDTDFSQLSLTTVMLVSMGWQWVFIARKAWGSARFGQVRRQNDAGPIRIRILLPGSSLCRAASLIYTKRSSWKGMISGGGISGCLDAGTSSRYVFGGVGAVLGSIGLIIYFQGK